MTLGVGGIIEDRHKNNPSFLTSYEERDYF